MIVPTEGVPIEDQPEEWLGVACVWAEARGEPWLGMLSVAYVILNRAKRYKWLVRKVILKPLHFSAFNKNDPNRDKMLTAHTSKIWEDCEDAWRAAVEGSAPDPTAGSTHYVTTKLYNAVLSNKGTRGQQWIKQMQIRARIGNHVFGWAP